MEWTSENGPLYARPSLDGSSVSRPGPLWRWVQLWCCCSSIPESKRKLRENLRVKLKQLWFSLDTGTKKWCEDGRTAAKLAVVANLHDLLRRGSRPWRRRRRKRRRDDRSESDSPVRIDDDEPRKRRKREGRAGRFFDQPETAGLLLDTAIATNEVRSCLSTIFSTERDARLGLVPDAGAGTLLSQLVGPEGVIEQTKARVEALLVDPGSPLGNMSRRSELVQDSTLTRNRSLGLRATGSFEQRLVQPLCRQNNFFEHHRAVTALGALGSEPSEAARSSAKRSFDKFMAGSDCCAEPYYARRVRRKSRMATGGAMAHALSDEYRSQRHHQGITLGLRPLWQWERCGVF